MEWLDGTENSRWDVFGFLPPLTRFFAFWAHILRPAGPDEGCWKRQGQSAVSLSRHSLGEGGSLPNPLYPVGVREWLGGTGCQRWMPMWFFPDLHSISKGGQEGTAPSVENLGPTTAARQWNACRFGWHRLSSRFFKTMSEYELEKQRKDGIVKHGSRQ